MTREFLKGIKSENRINNIRLIMLNDPVIGGQPVDDSKEFTSNTPLLDLACTMKFSIELGNEALSAAKKAQETADEASKRAEGAGSNANNRIPKKDVIIERDSSKEKVVSGHLLDVVEKDLQKEIESKTSYSSKQNVLWAQFLRKLKVDGEAKINCVGTSNTSKKPDYISYPESLQESLNDVYRNNVSVTNMGIGGGTVESNYLKWKNNTPEADLTIMEFTANDQGKTEIGKFVKDLETYIEYELDNNRAVLLITAPKMNATVNIRRDVYSAAMYGVANKYSIYILDTEKLFANYPSTIHYDGIHVNSEGGIVLGYKVAAMLTGEGIHNPRLVTSGSSLLGRPTLDSLIFGENVRQLTAAGDQITPTETNDKLGVTANFSGHEGKAYLYYAFYAVSDNLYITPNFRLYPGADIKFTLDGGTISPMYSLSNGISIDETIEISKDNTYYYKNITNSESSNNSKNYVLDPIPLVTAGWHILKIEVNHNICVLYGLDFHTSIRNVDIDYISNQNKAYALFLKKLKVDGNAVINCVGTTNTFGYTGYEAYPYYLEEALNDVYNNEIVVRNMGVSSGTVKDNFIKWKDNTPNADLTIMEFSALDQSRTPIEDFVRDLEKYIEYELSNNRAVVLITSPKIPQTININRTVYKDAMISIAHKYSLPILNSELLLANYPYSVYQGATTLKNEASSVLGYKVAAMFIGEGAYNPKKIVAGSSLLSRPTVDSLIFGNNARQFRGDERPPITPNEEDFGFGVTANLSGQDGKAYLYYAFYAESDNLYFTPNIKLYPGADVKFTLDGGLSAPMYSLTNGIAVDTSITVSKDNTYYYKNESEVNVHNSNQNRLFDPIPLVTAGWHILKIEVNHNIGVLYGIEFHVGLKKRNWHNVKDERLLNVEYMNKTDSPIDIDVTVRLAGVNFASKAELIINNVSVASVGFLMSGSAMNYVQRSQISRRILPGQRYKISGKGAEVAIENFEELKR